MGGTCLIVLEARSGPEGEACLEGGADEEGLSGSFLGCRVVCVCVSGCCI